MTGLTWQEIARSDYMMACCGKMLCDFMARHPEGDTTFLDPAFYFTVACMRGLGYTDEIMAGHMAALLTLRSN